MSRPSTTRCSRCRPTASATYRPRRTRRPPFRSLACRSPWCSAPSLAARTCCSTSPRPMRRPRGAAFRRLPSVRWRTWDETVTRVDEGKPQWVSRLEQVEWGRLDYSYGEPVNVSGLIQTIAFSDEAEACEACTTLQDQLVHQASVYSSTYEAIPFLIETLAVIGGNAGGRRGVLSLLGDIFASCIHWTE